MNWFAENWFKLGILILLALASIGGLLIYYNVETQKNKEEAELKRMQIQILEEKNNSEQQRITDQREVEINRASQLEECLQAADDWVNGALNAVQTDTERNYDVGQALDEIEKGFQEQKDECYRLYK